MNYRILWWLAYLFITISANAQELRPGFDKQEYIELMKISARFGDSVYASKVPPPAAHRFVYRSPVLGLDNMWDLYTNDKGNGVISIRGTTKNGISWMENFYAAMVPAKGELKLSDSETFKYELSAHPAAAVHVGWLIGTAYLSKDMLPKIDSSYKAGVRSFVIIGHSQGGAIAFLLTAYLHQLQQQQRLPQDIRFKTYCSAAPKPGNLYFAHEYEAKTMGWAYNVINSSDWVPETPFTVQTISDFNEINPFTNAKAFIKKQPWPRRWALSYAYGRMNKPSRKAAKNYRKYLGNFVSKSIRQHLKTFQPPGYAQGSYYVRTGSTIVLLADEEYFTLYPQDKKNVFVNHLHNPYIYLAEKLR